jgi:predicted Ser/Thr protein kinase
MKNLFTILLSAVAGAITALLFQRASSIAEAARKSRSLEEITPLYKEMVEKYTGDDQLYTDHQKAWIQFVRAAVQPNMTELEAQEVAQAVLSFHPPAYNFNPPMPASWEKEERQS